MTEVKKSLKFDEALKRLEEIVEVLESSDQPLEKALILFEEGVKLSHYCHSKLNEAEQKISLLIKNKSGNLDLRTFTPAETNIETKHDDE